MKKQKEETILDMIYSKDRIEKVLVGENPDFRLKNKYHNTYFGVEVTELYYSDSSARMKNIESYFDEIMNKKQFKHKKDIKELAVQKMTLLKPDGTPVEDINGIMQKFPSVEDYIKMIIDIIDKKDSRFPDYSRELTHVNLIIKDSDYRLLTLSHSDFYNVVFTKSLINTLCRSRFGEIFFITALEKDTEHLVYIPLKMLLFVSQLSLFNSVLFHHYQNIDFESIKEELILFADYLHFLGIKEIYASKIEDTFQLICGRYGVTVSKSQKVSIQDFNDYTLPEDAVLIEFKDRNSLIDDTFILKCDEAFNNCKFDNDLVFDVNIVDG